MDGHRVFPLGNEFSKQIERQKSELNNVVKICDQNYLVPQIHNSTRFSKEDFGEFVLRFIPYLGTISAQILMDTSYPNYLKLYLTETSAKTEI